MDLFLVRHGETDANAKGIVQGWLDTNLNERGHTQAQAVAEQFNEKIDAIYSSDLKRATQTAEAFRRKYPTVPYFEDEHLRERNFGDATGKHRDLHDWEVFWASVDSVSIPNAETLDEYSKRVQIFMDTLRESGFSKVLIVAHGGTINRFEDLTNEGHSHIAHENASVTHLVI